MLGFGLSLTKAAVKGAGGSAPEELWVQPPTTSNGAAGYYDVSGDTITINKDAGGEGNFQSDALLVSGTDYVLDFDWPETGGTYPDYSIDIRTTTSGLEVHLDLAPDPGHKTIPFTMPENGSLLFVCVDVDWSATYQNISLVAA